MLLNIISMIIRMLLSLRYRIHWKGLNDIKKLKGESLLFLPNHPALMDPVILMSRLYPDFKVIVLGDEEQVDRPVIRNIARMADVITIPDVSHVGASGADEIAAMMDKCVDVLNSGRNLMFYPAGQTMRSAREIIAGKSAVENIVKRCPDTKVVLVRTTGLWGSSFSRAIGNAPNVTSALKNAFKSVLANLIFFVPKRDVLIELSEARDFPSDGDRQTINAYLEEYYNRTLRPNTRIPYFRWEKQGPQVLPEPEKTIADLDISAVPESIRNTVIDEIADKAGIKRIEPSQSLSADLGMDSLLRADIALWIESKFGFVQSNPDALETVAHVMLAANGKAASSSSVDIPHAPAKWGKTPVILDEYGKSAQKTSVPDGKYITDVILKSAKLNSGYAAADINGGRTWSDLMVGITLMRDKIREFQDHHIGIMLPASTASAVAWLATLFAGKVPVMINWTVGPANMNHGLRKCAVTKVMTSKKLVMRLKGMGTDFSGIEDTFVFLEDFAAEWGLFSKLIALLKCRTGMFHLKRVKPDETAVILFTSGSETLPKAVPLSHENLLTNIRDVSDIVSFSKNDIELGMLPPFHSFGITTTILLPLALGIKIVYHPNPTESTALAKIIEEFGVTLLPGTPTFLGGIIHVANKKQLSTLRLTVTGAEKCTESVYEGLNRMCPDMKVLEGYGITECSPIIAANNDTNPIPFSIGFPMPSLDYTIVHPETLIPVKQGESGLLLVRGPSVFKGYILHDGESPFVECGGLSWYRTGDLVHQAKEGHLVFDGRIKRFIKLGGEMISMPAIENILLKAFPGEPDSGPHLAVECAGSDDNPRLVLFTTISLDREMANRAIREAGLSGLHNIREIISIPEIPLLGTGKTDYRSLKSKLN